MSLIGNCLECSINPDTNNLAGCSKCSDGYYLNDGKGCSECPYPCATCDGNGQCLTCIDDSFYETDTCDCIEGY